MAIHARSPLPLAEQHRIVAKRNQVMALCDRLVASLAAADNASRHLLEALREAPVLGEEALNAAE